MTPSRSHKRQQPTGSAPANQALMSGCPWVQSGDGECRARDVVDADDLDRLIAAAEDLADIEAARAARDEIADGAAAIPWDQVKADLGLA